MLEHEIWKPIPGYEGRYEVSSFGRIKSIYDGRNGHDKSLILKPCIRRCYLFVNLYDSTGTPKAKHIHRIVASVFAKKDTCRQEVNHLDGNKLNNRAENLEWVTRSENVKHAYSKGLLHSSIQKYAQKAGRISAINNSKKVRCIELNSIFQSACDAGRILGLKRQHIWRVCNGKRKSVSGYHFEYVSEVANG